MSKWVCNLTWEDAPHLNAEQKKELLDSYLPHERDARSKGLPQLGAGAIFPIPEDEICVRAFDIPDHWQRTYAFDVGWKKNAVLFGAYDKRADTWYIYDEYYRGYAEPAIHADAIRARGRWMRGLIDSASNAASTKDGMTLLDEYSRLGLDLSFPNKSVDVGLLEVFQRLSSGRLKFFSHLHNLLAEFRVYRRDLNGRIVKKNDHLMDCLRYMMMSGFDTLEYPPSEDNGQERIRRLPPTGRSKTTGY